MYKTRHVGLDPLNSFTCVMETVAGKGRANICIEILKNFQIKIPTIINFIPKCARGGKKIKELNTRNIHPSLATLLHKFPVCAIPARSDKTWCMFLFNFEPYHLFVLIYWFSFCATISIFFPRIDIGQCMNLKANINFIDIKSDENLVEREIFTPRPH